MKKKKEKLLELERYYRKQIETVKNYFGYTGSIEVLLSGDENTEDYKEAQKIREAKEDVNYYKKSIKEFEAKVRSKDDEIRKLKIENDIKLTDKTMIKYYFGVNEIKKKKRTRQQKPKR